MQGGPNQSSAAGGDEALLQGPERRLVKKSGSNMEFSGAALQSEKCWDRLEKSNCQFFREGSLYSLSKGCLALLLAIIGENVHYIYLLL